MQRINAFIVYLLSSLLLWQYIKPLEQITDTGFSYLFALFIVICLMLYVLNLPFFLPIAIKVLVITFFLKSIFYHGSKLSEPWLSYLIQDIAKNVQLIAARQWWDMSNLFRTLLFFILLWILAYLVHYWLKYKRSMLFFIVFTVVYLAVIDTFLPFDGKWAMIQTIVIGFFLMSYVHMTKLFDSHHVKPRMLPVSLLAMLLIGMSLVIGYTLPKFTPQWGDPVPYIQSKATQYQQAVSQGGGVKKIGYGTNDEQLGGPFLDDQTTVFQAKVTETNYWRVETKDRYTGKGWVVSQDAAPRQLPIDQINLGDIKSNVKTKKVTADISVVERTANEHYIYPAGVRQFKFGRQVELYVNPQTEKFSVKANGKIDAYQIVYDYPAFSLDELRTRYQASAPAVYTQLPTDLPKRVGELAQTITKDKKTVYDKAKAIERYLNAGDFVYDTKDVAIPGKNDDYVDQFLFETKTGYCDNFSTSMAVMLRTLDIPARWVKGYTTGDYVKMEDGKKVYDIKNKNAHSWVEVYFPDQGWVPFEPTKGFVNPYQFTQAAASEPTPTPKAKDPVQPKKEEQKSKPDQKKGQPGMAPIFWWIAPFLAAGLAFLFRSKWLLPLIVNRYMKRTDDQAFFSAYDQLLTVMNKRVQPMVKGQTLREYAANIDQRLGGAEMQQLTKVYEKALYAGKDAKAAWLEVKPMWENLIKRVWS